MNIYSEICKIKCYENNFSKCFIIFLLKPIFSIVDVIFISKFEKN